MVEVEVEVASQFPWHGWLYSELGEKFCERSSTAHYMTASLQEGNYVLCYCGTGVDYTESCNPLDIVSLQSTKSFHCNWTVTCVHLLHCPCHPKLSVILTNFSLLTNCTKQCVFNTMGIYNLQ